MDEREKYLNLYAASQGGKCQSDVIPGHMGGGYGRICWGENMLETLKIWNIASLLDVGCGYGNFCDAAALFVPSVFGLDIASVATGNVIDNPEITYLDGEAKQLPFPDNAVEWITSFDCLEHCLERDIDEILKEFDRVAAKGFVLSISYEPCEMDGMPLHMTVKPESWWIDKLSKYGQVSQEGKAPITGAPYLICRKSVEKYLICYCAGSIGTRLRSIALTDRLARQTGRRLILVWLENDPLCRISFTSLFRSPVPLISEKALLELSSCKIYASIKEVADQALISGGKSLRTAVQKWGSCEIEAIAIDDSEDHIIVYAPKTDIGSIADDSDNLLSLLMPESIIQNRIHQLTESMAINKSVIGVHARGTDFGIQADAYVQQMQKATDQNPNQSFLVCSDDPSYEQRLKREFPGRVIARPKSSWTQKKDAELPWALGNVDTCPASVAESLIDLYLLANTQFRIYHESSAFAQAGAWLSQRAVLKRNNKGGSIARNCKAASRIDQSNLAAAGSPPKRVMDAKVREGGDIDAAEVRHTIYYFCPQVQSPSAGIRRLYRHVSMLHDVGFPAYLMFEKKAGPHPDMPVVPVIAMDDAVADNSAIFVIPEGTPRMMHQLKDHPGRRFVIALSWCYVYSTLPDNLDWRHMNIERVLTVSPAIGEMIRWSMGLPVHQLSSSIDHRLYYFNPEEKLNQIAYIERKNEHALKLQSLLASRNPDYINKIKWVGIDGLSQQAYASQIRQSALFLSTSMAEGFPTSCLEAMAAGALVCGYDGVGSKDILRSDGKSPNSLIASNGDYVTLAYKMAPMLDDLIHDRMDRWDPVINSARRTADGYTAENEASSLITFWKRILYGRLRIPHNESVKCKYISASLSKKIQQTDISLSPGY